MKIKEKLNRIRGKESPINDETYQRVVVIIKEEYPLWGEIDDDLLLLFIKLAVKRYPTDMFENISEDELRVKVKNAFVHSNEAASLTPDKIVQLNNTYRNGKKLGIDMKKVFKKII
jgi:hypothetical protein